MLVHVPRRTATSLAVLVLAAAGVPVAVEVATAAPAHAATAPVVATTVGSGAFIDNAGQRWAPASGFAGGRLATPAPVGTAIRNASDQRIYAASRFGLSGWSAPVPNGSYVVTLHMVDTWFDHAGQRVFSVSAEGRTALSHVDIAGAVGKYAAYAQQFPVTVADGVLSLGFAGQISSPVVSAISVTPTTTAAPPVTATGGVPGPGNTGVPAGTVLTRRDGQVLLTTAGATYSNLDIHGRVRVMAPNVTLKNSIIRGDASSTLGSLVDANYPGADHHGFVLEDSELVPSNPSFYQDGILGHDYTVLRTNIHGTVDAVKVVGNNVRVQNSWLHDTYYVARTSSGLPTHNDGVQVLVGANIVVQGNRIDGNSNSGMQVTQDAGAVSNLVFSGNWAGGGGCTVNLAAKPLSSMHGITVSSNRFYRDSRVANCAIVSGPETALSASGNVWDDNGQPVAVSRGK